MPPAIEPCSFHGLEALRLTGSRGEQVVISRFGAQVLSWVTADRRERLYLSEQAVLDGSAPIRGGIPVCFPQFGTLGDLPRHGLVRTRPWQVAAQRTGEDYALVTLQTSDDAATRALWPHPFQLELTVMLEADRLDLELCVENTGSAPLSFTGALHSYLRVVQVEDAALEGLRGYDFRDQTTAGDFQRETGTELIVEAEMDRVYRNARRPLLLKAANHSLGIASEGFPDVVVWNPWVERCAAFPDLSANGWRHFLCVEAAVADTPVLLPPGEEWYGRQALVVV